MFSLIITIISIALVTALALALATVYYTAGGRAWLAKVRAAVEADKVRAAEAEAEAKALVDNAEAIVTKDLPKL